MEKHELDLAKHFLKHHAALNVPLSFKEAHFLGELLMRGCRGNAMAQIQSLAVLTALHTRATYNWKLGRKKMAHDHELPKNAAEQIAGICSAIFKDDIAKSANGFLQPNVDFAMDNCGMGGDMTVTANVSTLAAFIAAAGGVKMVKHGSPANADKGRHGSSDFIDMCGIDRFLPKAKVERMIEKVNFGYTEALDKNYKHIHAQTHEFAKLPHMNDIIGPITNPLLPSLLRRRVLGINHLIPPRVVAEAYKIMNQKGVTFLEYGLFVRGFADGNPESGMDELSICPGGTQVVELRDGNIDEYRLTANDFGLESVPVESISPPPGMSKGDFSMAILERRIKGPPAQMVAANAALLFYLQNPTRSLKNCYRQAEEILASDAAERQVVKIRELSKR